MDVCEEVTLVPGGAFIAGAWQQSERELAVADPEDGRVVGYVASSTKEDVARAIAGVDESLKSEAWPVWARRESLEASARLVEAQSSDFARLIASEGVKTLAEAEREVRRCVETLRLSAEAGAYLTGETIPFEGSRNGVGKIGWFTREPVGIVAAITSFNDPLNLVAHKVGPALMAGNGVVLKPSSFTPLTALALTNVLVASGVPAGRIAVVCGGAEVGNALVTDARISLVSFTGGPRTARKITDASGPRKMLMELGGDNPTIVCADADLAVAVEDVVSGAFGVAGQNCLSVQRVYVHNSLFDRFLRDVVDKTRRLRVGSKFDPNTDIGPLITEAAAIRVERWVDEARASGATVHVGGRRTGSFYDPTVLTGVPATSPLITEEVFGPVVTVMAFDDTDEAIRAANSTDYALQAGLFTQSVDTAYRIAAQITAGAVIVNGTSDLRSDAMPFGGFKSSGIGREGVRFALEAMTEPKNIIVNLSASAV
ncbi:MAG TPA: aldehyde dehydrogenase family protein [Leifsonia sp.]|nr:aldehyde dehydrogenase family protein [Leifsonia sp.]